MELLHLENIRERLQKQTELVGSAPLTQEFLELLDLVEKVIEAPGDYTYDAVSELEEWAR